MNYESQEAQWAIDYHKPEETKYIDQEEPIFSQIMDVLRNKGLTHEEQNQIIHLYVEATHAKFWEGWHSHGIAQAKMIISKHQNEEVNA